MLILRKSSKLFGFCLAVLIQLVSSSARAAIFDLPVLTTSQTTPIFNTLAAGFVFRDVEPASDLGKNWGLNFGVRASLIDTTSINGIVSGMSLAYLPTADAQISLGVPYGFTFEFGMVPGLSYQSTQFSQYAAAIKWTATRKVLQKFPLSLAARAAYSSATLSSAQTLNNADITVTYGTSIYSFQVLMSKKFLVFEPFVGIGTAIHSSSLASTGAVSIFGNDFPLGTNSYTGSTMSIWPTAGLLIDLYFLGIAADYSYLWGLTTYNAKISIRF